MLPKHFGAGRLARSCACSSHHCSVRAPPSQKISKVGRTFSLARSPAGVAIVRAWRAHERVAT
eukprot:5724870-Pleurochrysis_carterae.AAC.1